MSSSFFFFFNDTATTEIYTLSLHDALPISASPLGRSITSNSGPVSHRPMDSPSTLFPLPVTPSWSGIGWRSEEHTSELQSQSNLVCRLLLEKKKNNTTT